MTHTPSLVGKGEGLSLRYESPARECRPWDQDAGVLCRIGLPARCLAFPQRPTLKRRRSRSANHDLYSGLAPRERFRYHALGFDIDPVRSLTQRRRGRSFLLVFHAQKATPAAGSSARRAA